MSATTTARPLRIFISYTHSDEKLKDELGAHLASLRRAKLIEDWHDRKIGAGQEWKNAIDQNLERAQIVLLLISARFLNSSYCMDIEMKRALERHDEGKARVIPIILRPCNWHSSPFSKLQAVPTDGRSVLKHRSHDEAWTVVAREIETAAQQFRSSTTAQRRRQNKQAAVKANIPVTLPETTKVQRTPRPKDRASMPEKAVSSGSHRTRATQSAVPPSSTPVDSVPLLQRARSLVVRERSNYYGDGSLQVIVVGGPLQQVLRPAEIEDEALLDDLELKALHGRGAILTRGEKYAANVEKGTLRIAQELASFSLTEDGALAIVQPARRKAPTQGFGFSALIEEDVLASIERALAFAGIALDRIDPGKRLSSLAFVAALDGIGHSPWRTLGEQAKNSNSGSLGRGENHIVVALGSTIPRAALSKQLSTAAKDLMVLLRREVKG